MGQIPSRYRRTFNRIIFARQGKCHLERKIEVEDVDNEGKKLSSDECFSAHGVVLLPVFQIQRLENANPPRDRLPERARHDFLDREVEDVDGGEAGEDDPVELLEQLSVGSTVKDQAPICIADEDDPPDEAEEEGVEVSHHYHVPRDGEQLAPRAGVKTFCQYFETGVQQDLA